MLQRMQFPQSAQTSPTQTLSPHLSARLPADNQPAARIVGSFDPRPQERPLKDFLRYTLNPKQLGSGVKSTPSWEHSTQREEQSLYSNPTLSMSTTLIRKASGEGVSRPNIPFAGLKMSAPILNKEKGSSPVSELQRSGQEIRQKVSTYFERNWTSKPQIDPKQKFSDVEKSTEKGSNEEQKSFYSNLFTDKDAEDFDRSEPMFIKRNQLYSDTKTPKPEAKKSIEMEPKRNTNLFPSRFSDEEISPASSPLTASFKRKPSNPTSSTSGLKIDDFHVYKDPIGSGRFGKVYLVKHKQTRTIFALKKMSKRMIKSLKMIHQVTLEIKLQMFLDHPNITKMYGFFDDSEYIYLIMEYMEEGTLYELIQKQQTSFKEHEIAMTTLEISRAIQIMDDQFVAHRDIKPENILMSHVIIGLTQGIAKLSDFGWSTICDERRTTYCATPAYLSPQMVEGKDYDQTIDLWCLGVLVYQMVTGKVPFSNPSKRETERQILNADLTKLSWPQQVSAEVRSFVESLLQRDPTKRTKACDLLSHPFLKQLSEE